MATINDFSVLDIRVAKILDVQDLEGAKKPLYRLKVDVGELGERTVIAGIKTHYSKEELVGKTIVILANLEKKMIMNIESEGMILAADDGDKVSMLVPDKEMKPGSRVR